MVQPYVSTGVARHDDDDDDDDDDMVMLMSG